MAAVLASFPTSFTSNAFGKRFQELMVGIGKLWVEEALYVDHGGLYSWAKQKTKQNINFLFFSFKSESKSPRFSPDVNAKVHNLSEIED